MNYLIVVAHPDDEVLGAGATMHKLIKEGHNVAVAIWYRRLLLEKIIFHIDFWWRRGIELIRG